MLLFLRPAYSSSKKHDLIPSLGVVSRKALSATTEALPRAESQVVPRSWLRVKAMGSFDA